MRVFLALLCVAMVLLGILAVAVLIFQIACSMARAPRPSFPRAASVLMTTFFIWSLAEGALAATVHAIYVRLQYPPWEAGLVTFFLGLPVDLVITSGIHAALLRLSFGKAVEVWFAHRLILLTLAMALAGVFAIIALTVNN